MMRALLFLLLLPLVTSFYPSPPSHIITTTKLNNWFNEFIEMATLGPSERRLKKSQENISIDDDDDLTPLAFRQEIARIDAKKYATAVETSYKTASTIPTCDKVFTGITLSNLITEKYGSPLDIDLRPVTSFGKTSIYLAIMPIPAFGSKKSRFNEEKNYLEHLQAIIEILEKYNQLSSYLTFLKETNKKPRGGTSPLIAVTWRLELTEEEVEGITGG
ncbi:hypothetical protein TL16_g11107 [Triparma laevis f. inornata]|uniref:Uncharacterized protein n=1 Tax=Triparma laevis f. inornata TaxID=1714386 RepID=A0A9W7BCW2_9STRA|nr:hypothetical protein TL16_g11107 [Triparma laevis f. inornata]